MKRLAPVVMLALAGATGARADDAITMQSIYRDWMVPHSAEMVAENERLVRVLKNFCAASPQAAEAALGEVRLAWIASLVAWERVSTVAIGPVLTHRLQSQLDFAPTRPRMIAKAVEAGPRGAEQMDLIGTPAKGFPALEWMLWTRPVEPASAECRYAVQVAMEIEREARVMEKLFRQDAAAVLDAEAAKLALNELVNQWVGGLERLRWAEMERPVQEVATAGKKTAPAFPRHASGASAASWTAQWETLHAHAAGEGPASLAFLLRERGQGKVADALVQSVEQADTGMKGLDARNLETLLAAAGRLSALKHLVESEVAPALDVRIGFSDADGD